MQPEKINTPTQNPPLITTSTNKTDWFETATTQFDSTTPDIQPKPYKSSTGYKITLWVLWGFAATHILLLIAAIADGSAGAGWVAVSAVLGLIIILPMIAALKLMNWYTAKKILTVTQTAPSEQQNQKITAYKNRMKLILYIPLLLFLLGMISSLLLQMMVP